jgi:hypothetical protein
MNDAMIFNLAEKCGELIGCFAQITAGFCA